jgi:hypothetical protein
MTLTRDIAYAAAFDAGNRSMRKAGRIVWSEEDFRRRGRRIRAALAGGRRVEIARFLAIARKWSSAPEDDRPKEKQ